MKSKVVVTLVIACTILSLGIFGCKTKAEKAVEEPLIETPDDISLMEITPAEEMQGLEPAESVATETIPPTAAPPTMGKQAAVAQERLDRNKEIQIALKNAGFYKGAIDGKIGPRSRIAIEEFQKENGLKVDGKVGPKTWAVLEKYLSRQ